MPQNLGSRVSEFYKMITQDVETTKKDHSIEIAFFETMESIIHKTMQDKPLNDNEKGWILDLVHSKVDQVRDN